MGHKAWKLQLLLWDLQDWAQGLKAAMGMRGTPCSPERAQYMLQEHQAYKVSHSPKVLGLSDVTPSLPPIPVTFLCLLTNFVLFHPPLDSILPSPSCWTSAKPQPTGH